MLKQYRTSFNNRPIWTYLSIHIPVFSTHGDFFPSVFLYYLPSCHVRFVGIPFLQLLICCAVVVQSTVDLSLYPFLAQKAFPSLADTYRDAYTAKDWQTTLCSVKSVTQSRRPHWGKQYYMTTSVQDIYHMMVSHPVSHRNMATFSLCRLKNYIYTYINNCFCSVNDFFSVNAYIEKSSIHWCQLKNRQYGVTGTVNDISWEWQQTSKISCFFPGVHIFQDGSLSGQRFWLKLNIHFLYLTHKLSEKQCDFWEMRVCMVK